jgi:hypothetical protein
MTEQPEPHDTKVPSDPAAQEPAEGSRNNVDDTGVGRRDAGITNRPIEEEQREQQNLPPRGDSKEGGHA